MSGYLHMPGTLEKRVERLEREVGDLRRILAISPSVKNWRSTFGAFADDPEYEEMIRLGREFREQDRKSSDPDADP